MSRPAGLLTGYEVGSWGAAGKGSSVTQLLVGERERERTVSTVLKTISYLVTWKVRNYQN